MSKPSSPRQRFVVIIQNTDQVTIQVIGPYLSFKKAEGDAKAWDGVYGATSVEPLNPTPQKPN